MDFSSDVLIEFGLNLAGYIVVALLVYVVLAGRMSRKAARAEASPAAETEKTPVSPQATAVPIRRPEFVSLAEAAAPETQKESQQSAVPASRQENRRAIYREARQLLAKGKSRAELLHRLPLTDNELEMLTVTGKA